MRQRTFSARHAKTARDPEARNALGLGLRLLGRRAHSRAELRQKFERRGFDAAEVDEALAALAKMGYLDDGAFARGLIRRRSGSRGALAMALELAAKGVEKRVAVEALDELGLPAQVKSATLLARKLEGRPPATTYRDLLGSVGLKLSRRGFSTGVIRAACAALIAETASSPAD